MTGDHRSAGANALALNETFTPAGTFLTRRDQGTALRLLSGRAGRNPEEEYVEHSTIFWTDEGNAGIEFTRLRKAWVEWLGARSSPATEETKRKAANVLMSFCRSLVANGDPEVLASLHKTQVNRWLAEQRMLKRSEDGIASRLSTLKAFANRFVFKEMKLCVADPLGNVERINLKTTQRPRLTDDEVKQVMAGSDEDTFEGVRNRAMLMVFASTGRRLREVVEKMTVSGLDRLTGEFTVPAKGGAVYPTRMSPAALKAVKEYLRERPKAAHDALWVSRIGAPLTGWGAMIAIRRLRQSLGIKRLNSHLFRHTLAQRALEHGAERAMVMDMLGHSTDRAARIYAGNVRQTTAAKAMPKYSPV